MAKERNTSVDTTDNVDAKEQARQQIAALLAQFGNSIVPVTVAAERLETAKTENAAEIAALQQANTDLRAQIDPLNAQIKENLVKLMALTGKKSVSAVSGTGKARTEKKCPECGQGRHSYWKNKAKGEVNTVTANCQTFQTAQKERLAKAAAAIAPPTA